MASIYKPLRVKALKLYLLKRPLPFTGFKVAAESSKVELFDLRVSKVKSFDLRTEDSSLVNSST